MFVCKLQVPFSLTSSQSRNLCNKRKFAGLNSATKLIPAFIQIYNILKIPKSAHNIDSSRDSIAFFSVFTALTSSIQCSIKNSSPVQEYSNEDRVILSSQSVGSPRIRKKANFFELSPSSNSNFSATACLIFFPLTFLY